VTGAFIAPRSPLNLKIGMPQSEQRSDEVEFAAGPPTSVASSRRVDGRLTTHSVGPPPGARSPAPFCDIIWPQWKCALSGACGLSRDPRRLGRAGRSDCSPVGPPLLL